MQRAKIRTSLVPQLGLQTRSKLQLSCEYFIPKRNRMWSTHKNHWNKGYRGNDVNVDIWMAENFSYFFCFFYIFNYFFNAVKEMLTFHISIEHTIFNPKMWIYKLTVTNRYTACMYHACFSLWLEFLS